MEPRLRSLRQSDRRSILESLEQRALLSSEGGLLDMVSHLPIVQDFLSSPEGQSAQNVGSNLEKESKDEEQDQGDGRWHGKWFDAAPTAEMFASDVSTRGGTSATLTIAFHDDKRIRTRSIGSDDVVVIGPGGQSLGVNLVSLAPPDENKDIVATFSITARGGHWDPDDNGNYDITLQPNEVFDSKWQSVGSISGRFHVSIAQTDVSAPQGSLLADGITSAGGNSHTVKAFYGDDVGVNLRSIGPNDLNITAPGGTNIPVRSVSLDSNKDNTHVTAIYTFDAPGGSWDSKDNGTYQFSLNPEQVRDGSGKSATASAASFTVNVAPPAPVDSAFGASSGNASGRVRTSFIAEAVVAQPDGKLLVAGHSGDLASGTSRGVVQRFNPDGSLDSFFGVRGKAITAPGGNDAYYAIALDASGSIFAAGMRSGDVLLSKFAATGKADASFDQDGSATVSFGSKSDSAYAVGISPDGRIVVAGGPGDNFAIARFLPTGVLDPNFSQGGVNLFDLGSNDDTPGAVAFQDDKTIIVGTSAGKVAVVRLKANGEADSTFSQDGLLLLDTLTARSDGGAFTDRTAAAAVQSDGKLLLANRSAGGDFAIARLNTNGALDKSFGKNGTATIDFGGDDDADAIVVQDTGEILVIGTTNVTGAGSTAIAALDSSGGLITEFGAGGKLTVSADVEDTSPRAMHLSDLVIRAFGTRQPDGRVVVGAASNSGSTTSTNSAPLNSGTSLRRLNVPGTHAQPLGTQLGSFGVADGKHTTLTLTDADGTQVTFAASRGAGVVYELAGRYNLSLSDGPQGVIASIRATGGSDDKVTLGDVSVSGALRSLRAKAADLAGTLYASGSIAKLCLAEVTGSIAAAGSIGSVMVQSIQGAKLMSGTNFGADGRLGGTGSDADGYGAGSIDSLRVAGSIEASTISAGLNPGDGVFFNDDDTIVGGDQSVIRSVFAKQGADDTARFIAGRVVSVRLPIATNPKTDERVVILA